MQDNVKKPSIKAALLAAMLTAIIMLVPFLISTNTREVIYLPELSADSNIKFTEKDGIRYIGQGFSVADYTKTVSRGEKASVTVLADSEVIIDIRAYYKSGRSVSEIFSPKRATDGSATWVWTVPKASTSDKIRIVLRTESSYATFDIEII